MSAARRFSYAIAALWGVALAWSLGFGRPEFRPWERLYDEGTRRFAASRQLEMDAIGDLGYESWVRELQVERRVRFTTDRWGLRNPTDVERPRVVVLGDSYVAGSSVSDDETLTARMAERLGEPVYNFGIQSIDAPGLFLLDERFARHPPAVVIWAPVSRRIRPRPLFFPREQDGPASPWERLREAWRGLGAAIARAEERLNRDNGLSRGARFAWNGLRYRLLGHPRQLVVEGTPVLALDVEAQGLHVPPEWRGVDAVVQMVAVFSRFLADHGVHLIYCPLPESATIYPELFPPEQRAKLQRPSFLDRLVEGARRAGVEVVDLRPVFRARRTPYLYQRDDSHWNARAIDIAAEALAQAVRRYDAREPAAQAASGAAE